MSFTFDSLERLFTSVDESTEQNFKRYCELLEEGKYSDAINFVEECYKDEDKDYKYYYLIGNIQVEEGSLKNMEEGIKNFGQALTLCPPTSSDIQYIKAEVDDAISQKKWDEVRDEIEKLSQKRKFKSAKALLDEFYEKNNEEKDFYYYDVLFDMHLEQETGRPNAGEWKFSMLEKDILRMKAIIEEEQKEGDVDNDKLESLQTSENILQYYKKVQKIRLLTEEKHYPAALQELNGLISSEEDGEEDFYIWELKFRILSGAVSNNVALNGNIHQDLQLMGDCLDRMKSLQEDEDDAKVIEECEAVLTSLSNEHESVSDDNVSPSTHAPLAPQQQEPAVVPPQYSETAKRPPIVAIIIGLAAVALIVFFVFRFFATDGGGERPDSIGEELYQEDVAQKPTYQKDYAGDPEYVDDLNYPDYDWLSERYATPSDVAGLNKDELRIMRNYIFARHGYIFKSQDLKDYFSNYYWYEPLYNNVTPMLNDTELRNIDFIKRYE